jgi:hypothetical protein
LRDGAQLNPKCLWWREILLGFGFLRVVGALFAVFLDRVDSRWLLATIEELLREGGSKVFWSLPLGPGLTDFMYLQLWKLSFRICPR